MAIFTAIDYILISLLYIIVLFSFCNVLWVEIFYNSYPLWQKSSLVIFGSGQIKKHQQRSRGLRNNMFPWEWSLWDELFITCFKFIMNHILPHLIHVVLNSVITPISKLFVKPSVCKQTLFVWALNANGSL